MKRTTIKQDMDGNICVVTYHEDGEVSHTLVYEKKKKTFRLVATSNQSFVPPYDLLSQWDDKGRPRVA